MKYSVDTTLLLESDVSTDHVLFTTSSKPSKQGAIPLTSSMPPPSYKIVSFDWNNILEPLLPSFVPFQIRVEVYSFKIY